MNKLLLFFIICVSSSFAALTHPPNGSELSYIHIMFRWEAEGDATDYRFELSSLSDFSTPLISEPVADTKYLVQENIGWQSTYYWRVKPVGGTFLGSSFTTKSASYQFSGNVSPVEITTYNPALASDGITIYGSMTSFYSAAIDMNGNEIWNSGGVDSYIFTSVDTNHTFLGVAHFPPNNKGELGLEFTIEDGIVWSQPTYGDGVNFFQHDLIKLPDGNYMGFVPVFQDHYVPNSDDYPQYFEESFDFSWEDDLLFWDGVSPYDWEWKGERIVEWDVDGNEVWSWNVFDKFNLNDFDYLSGLWEFTISENTTYDWVHVNSLAYDDLYNTLYLSSKSLSRITKINRNNDDIIWQIGRRWLGESDLIQPNLASNRFSGQHGLHLLEDDHMVIFDNGTASGNNDGTFVYKSRAMELKVVEISGEYHLDIVWSYTLPTELYGYLSGNVQKLENGNYLITTIGDGDGGAHSLEVTPSHEIVWDCKYNVGTPHGYLYRAMRIPSLYDSTYDYTNLSLSSQHLPNSFTIKSVYPNPFNPIVTMEYEISQLGDTSGKIYNLNGQLIENLFSEYKNIGHHTLIWDASDYPSGIYFIQLKNQSQSLTQKIMLLK